MPAYALHISAAEHDEIAAVKFADFRCCMQEQEPIIEDLENELEIRGILLASIDRKNEKLGEQEAELALLRDQN